MAIVAIKRDQRSLVCRIQVADVGAQRGARVGALNVPLYAARGRIKERNRLKVCSAHQGGTGDSLRTVQSPHGYCPDKKRPEESRMQDSGSRCRSAAWRACRCPECPTICRSRANKGTKPIESLFGAPRRNGRFPSNSAVATWLLSR